MVDSAMPHKAAPYIYHSETRSLCEECLMPVPTKVLIEGDNVFYQKRCLTHGVQKTLVATDVDYWRATKLWIKPGDRPNQLMSRTEYGCPFDCGLCPDHEQHSCLALIEVTERCNLTCPVCFSGSSPTQGKHRSLEEISALLDTLVAGEGQPDVLQISGGEPTEHPDIIAILKMCKERPIRHLMLNTNGVRLAKDRDFVAELKKLAPGFEVYLQFDSLQADALKNLRGSDLRRVRQLALENLEAAGISTSLVVVVKKGVNDGELGAIIDHALGFSCVRGVTFQPVQDAGRNEGFDKNEHRALLTDIRRAIYSQSSHFKAEDIIPLPCNPEHIAIGYGLRNGNTVMPITSLLPQDFFVKAAPNAIAFEKYPDLMAGIFQLFSLSSAELNEPDRIGGLLCCLPAIPLPEKLGYKDIFRVTIVEFMDRYNFDVGDVKRSCIHFVVPGGKIIPFDTYNLFYRDNKVEAMRKAIACRS